MTTPLPELDEISAEVQQTITAAEKASMTEFETQRRLNLIRFITPAILILATLGLPGAIVSDIGSQSLSSTTQDAFALVGCLVSLWALRQRRVNLAAFALFAGVTCVVYFVVINDTLLSHRINLSILPEFSLLLIPIVVAGIIGGPRLILFMTCFTPIFTAFTIATTPHAADLAARLAMPDGAVVYTVPLPMQIVTGILILATTNGVRRTQRQLNTVRVAYARERELDRLKNQFISNVNHELRTPLMSMRGYLVLARELGMRQDLPQQEYMLMRGIETVEHMESLVAAILNVRTIETENAAFELLPVKLRDTIVAATHLLEQSIGGNQERTLRLKVKEEVTVLADEEKLRQVMLNLLSNACKYSPPSEAIDIMAKLLPATASASGRADGTAMMVEVTVRDYGLGVPPEQIPLLFQRFVRLERDIASQVPGTGLGLAICRAYIESMGGKISVTSSGVEGEGAAFVFTLPLATPIPVDAVPVGQRQGAHR